MIRFQICVDFWQNTGNFCCDSYLLFHQWQQRTFRSCSLCFSLFFLSCLFLLLVLNGWATFCRGLRAVGEPIPFISSRTVHVCFSRRVFSTFKSPEGSGKLRERYVVSSVRLFSMMSWLLMFLFVSFKTNMRHTRAHTHIQDIHTPRERQNILTAFFLRHALPPGTPPALVFSRMAISCFARSACACSPLASLTPPRAASASVSTYTSY